MNLSLGIIRDFRAENWPSMDLCADQLLKHLPLAAPNIQPIDLEWPFRKRFQMLPVVGSRGIAFNADRLLNRQVYLPRSLRRRSTDCDCFHIVDHSYAHLVHSLPPGRIGVYCHDLDAFRSLLDPSSEPRPWWFRKIARRILTGLKAATVVFHNSSTVGQQIVNSKLVPPDRLVHAPLGVSEEFTPDSSSNHAVKGSERFLLHVGSNTPRKRLDVLLDVFAHVKQKFPTLRLVQVGGPWPRNLSDQIDRLKLEGAIEQKRGLSRQDLAELYCGAAAVLVTSEAEGFGLPIIEALACGAVVIASDIPVIREVGSDAVIYAPVAAVEKWSDTVVRVLTEPEFAPARHLRLAVAVRYSWREHARVIGETYLRLACESSS